MLPESVWLLRLAPRTQRPLTPGCILAIVLAVLVYFLLWRTTLGYRIRMVGLNPSVARYAGVPVPSFVALSLIWAAPLPGCAGAVEVTGAHHRMLEGMSGGYGFSGIVAALLASCIRWA